MRNLLTSILLIGSNLAIEAQELDSLPAADSLMLLNQLPSEADQLSTDILQNFYLTKGQELFKYDRAGNLLFQYSNNRYGELTWIEATYPFHTQLFFKDYQRLVLLDNTLSEITNYNLQDFGYYESSAVTISFDNNLWIFDAISGELRKIDRQGKVLFASDNLFYQLDTDPAPIRLIESKKYVLLLDENQGFFLFDIFGKFIQKLDIPITVNFQLRRDHLIYENDGSLYLFNLEFKNTEKLMTNTGKGDIKNIRLESTLIYELGKNGVSIYKLSGK